MKKYTSIGLFSGAGGLDLGFELAGFKHLFASDIDPISIQTIKTNRPKWHVAVEDVRNLNLKNLSTDVLLAGFPCQGFSLGGHRRIEDERNSYYLEAVRLTREIKPRIVVFENVLNLRTMSFDGLKSAAETIKMSLEKEGYEVRYDYFKVSKFGVPQTRRRFICLGFRDGISGNYMFPSETEECTVIKEYLQDLATDSIQGSKIFLPNHEFDWNYNSKVHFSRKKNFIPNIIKKIFPVRLSRTASDGNPIRAWDQPMPAIDTGTIWGFAGGDVTAERFLPDRDKRKFVRNRNSDAKLWKIEADFIRRMSVREMARIQTFPDNWTFSGNTIGVQQKQIGNAVPVNFAKIMGLSIKNYLQHLDYGIELNSNFFEMGMLKRQHQLF